MQHLHILNQNVACPCWLFDDSRRFPAMRFGQSTDILDFMLRSGHVSQAAVAHVRIVKINADVQVWVTARMGCSLMPTDDRVRVLMLVENVSLQRDDASPAHFPRHCHHRRTGEKFEQGILVFTEDVILPAEPRPDRILDDACTMSRVIPCMGLKRLLLQILRNTLPTRKKIGRNSFRQKHEAFAQKLLSLVSSRCVSCHSRIATQG